MYKNIRPNSNWDPNHIQNNILFSNAKNTTYSEAETQRGKMPFMCHIYSKKRKLLKRSRFLAIITENGFINTSI